jgi:hypothetical protein
MDHDFLDGIDERFERLMSESGNGGGNGRRADDSSRSGGEAHPGAPDPKLRVLLAAWSELSERDKDEILALVRRSASQPDLF